MTASEAYNENLDLLEVKPVNGLVKVGRGSSLNALSVQPNPNNGSFHIEVNGMQDTDAVETEVYSIIGEKLFVGNPSTVGNLIPVNVRLNAGLYVLQVRVNGQTFRKRFVVI
jgi:hypothetical protein